jgi:hypothetical protein
MEDKQYLSYLDQKLKKIQKDKSLQREDLKSFFSPEGQGTGVE